MKSATKIILAMAPGRRAFGVAVFNENELTYFAVRTIRNRQSEKLLKSEIRGLIQEFIAFSKPEAIALKAVSQYQKMSASLGWITRAVKREAAKHHILLAEISLEQVKSVLCAGEKRTQKQAFQNLSVFYPELQRFLNRPNRWQTEYYHKLFSAVAIGVVCGKIAL